MKLLVCISKAPDTTSKISFTNNNTTFNESGVQFIVNPYDEWFALVRALEIKETLGGSVTIITVGTAVDDAIIRKALAIGADEAVRIDAQPLDALYVAKQLAAYAKGKDFDIILTGKETIDYNGSQVGGMLAELLDQPFISHASKLDINANTATLEIDIPGGSEVVEVNTPFVVSASKGMAEARIPNMRGIMAARTKPLNVVAPVDLPTHTSIKSYSLPVEKKGCKMIPAETPEQLIELLHNEAKAI
ncbi:MAG: electron transfer flavoprotein subunit beta/FixA family protein [Bacteroidetes bacterium]|nr:electron transfer flavoprotein subunit beta/FixA family protein [Bacteroidota bacterium]HET6243506.1 electron transfer flavoprotein subunit beta/FixA family protein [Bacteroidia bacterium]